VPIIPAERLRLRGQRLKCDILTTSIRIVR
jgi:hypothetical protein